jgi:hypothetical protein
LPVLAGEFGKLRPEQAPHDFGCIVEAFRLRQLAHVALDAHQPAMFDHRADVVEYRADD